MSNFLSLLSNFLSLTKATSCPSLSIFLFLPEQLPVPACQTSIFELYFSRSPLGGEGQTLIGVSAPCRSTGGQLSSCGLHDSRGRASSSSSSSAQFSARPLFTKAGGGGGERDREREQREQREQRERLAQCSRLFCRPEHRGDIWNQQRRRSANYEV